MGTGNATLTLSLKWDGVPVASTTHALRVLEPGSGKTLPVSSRFVRSLPHPDRTANLIELRFGGEGRLFASGYPSGVAQVWDPNTGKEVRRIESPQGYRGSADYALTTDALKTLYVPIEGRKVTKLDDPKRRFRIDYDGHLLVYDLATGKAKEPIKAEKGRGVVMGYLSPDGTRLVTVERGGYFGGEDGPPDLVRLIDTATGKARKLGDGFAMPAFSPDRQRIYLSVSDREEKTAVLRVFSVEGKELSPLDTITGKRLTYPVISPDGKHLAIQVSKGRINEPGSIWLYDLATNKRVAEFQSGGSYPFMVPAFSPDGRVLACGDYDESVHLWDVVARKAIRTQRFKGMGMGVRVAFSKDGTKLAVPMRVKSEQDRNRDQDPLDLPQPRVMLFDLKKGGEPEELVCPHGWAGGVAFSADGKLLAVGGAGAVHLFDVAK